MNTSCPRLPANTAKKIARNLQHASGGDEKDALMIATEPAVCLLAFLHKGRRVPAGPFHFRGVIEQRPLP